MTWPCAGERDVRLRRRPEGSRVLVGRLGRPLDPAASEFFTSIGLTDDDSPNWFFAKVPEAKITKNRVHVDLATDDREAEIARLVDLGATRGQDHDEWGHSWTVMADPEGNEFCVS